MPKSDLTARVAALPGSNWLTIFFRRMAEGLPGRSHRAGRGQPVLKDRPQTGHIAFVGAGPGDPDLLTLKAVRALQSADLILCDALVPHALRAAVPTKARWMETGKRAGAPSWAQGEINSTFVAAAHRGLRVVRLKTGDPTLFGRLTEELEAAAKAGLSVEIIPGVTAASGAASALGRSLTNREAARGVAFLTGMDKRGTLSAHNWSALADPSLLLVIYMPTHTLKALAKELLAQGRPASTLVTCIANATQGDERVEKLTLEALVSQPFAKRPGEALLALIEADPAECVREIEREAKDPAGLDLQATN